MMPGSLRTKWPALLVAASGFLLHSHAGAAELRLRPVGPELTRTVQTLLTELAPKEAGLELRLNTASGPRIVWGNESGVPFNPDLVARISGRGGSRLIELNPAGPLNRAGALRQVLQSEFELGAWTPEAARLRFSGADLNADGQVDLADLALMMEAYGGTGRGDLDGNRRVDRADLDLFGKHYRIVPLQAPAPQQPAAPQPAGLAPAEATPGAKKAAEKAPPPAPTAGEPDAEARSAEPPPSAATEEPQPDNAPGPSQAVPTEPVPAKDSVPAPPTP